MKLHNWGGAGEHGRSCYYIEGENVRLLLDCGVKKEAAGQYPLLDPAKIPELDAVFLSHAHDDHAMALPLLYKYGYEGEIWTTRATQRQLRAGFAGWKRFVEGRGGSLPYDDEHVERMRFRYLEDYALPCGWFELPAAIHAETGSTAQRTAAFPQRESRRIRVQWGRTGHLAGSVWLRLEAEGKRIFFSGDYSRESLLLAADAPGADSGPDRVLSTPRPFPVRDLPDDLSIVDNAYGSDEEDQVAKLERLGEEIGRALGEGGAVLLPLPSFGRGQDLLLWACERFDPYPIAIDGAIWNGLRDLLEQPLWLRHAASPAIAQRLEQHSHRLLPMDSEETRLAALEAGGPRLILAADGTMESAVSRRYLKTIADDPRNRVLLTGHVYPGSFADELLRERVAGVRCRVRKLNYKVHQGLGDVRAMLDAAPSACTVLVHAPEPSARRAYEALFGEGRRGLRLLFPGDVLSF
ncbi:MBL fold metallo-hydrolase [Saccharibacillus sp. CPCC 101409]|uniref:MBL fold metallo-hydrolase n=1 Tax=Saccharibacillus sp. CPCC 101409 TaxID=3058041 RepID=UPI0026722DB0|nr:MBL fold metallo-hydrolase [Saccharibacillus sp. CPCC 101409]MDO3412221.1 MBL fold metallo-hydrolase [Saccharibacillus sp. CPCC 101409]